MEKFTEVANTIMARDYKGFGTGFDTQNGVVETTIMSRPHGYFKGGIEETNVFPTVRKASTMSGNNGVVEWKKSNANK